MPIVIDSLLAGKALDLALKGVRDAVRAFAQQDAVGRLLVLLHADFGAEADLGREVFYAWRTDPRLAAAFEAVLTGDLLDDDAGLQQLANVVAPRLVRTPPDARQELAHRIASAVFRAAPIVVEGGTAETLLLAHLARSDTILASAEQAAIERAHANTLESRQLFLAIAGSAATVTAGAVASFGLSGTVAILSIVAVTVAVAAAGWGARRQPKRRRKQPSTLPDNAPDSSPWIPSLRLLARRLALERSHLESLANRDSPI